MKLSPKDKSFILLISAILVIFWAVFSLGSTLFFSVNFSKSEVNKIFTKPEQKWLNISRPLTEADLKDRVVLLHFWNRSCVSCITSLPEIKKLEQQLGDKLVVIGVYSAKFEGEKDARLIENAVLKHDITHAVVVDDDLKIWQNFNIKAWPSFVLLNAHGALYETYVGENSTEELAKDTKKLISRYRYKINSEPLPLAPEKFNKIGNVLRFPSKLEYAFSFPYKTNKGAAIFISNAGQNNIIATNLDGDILLKVGREKENLVDGNFDEASFNSPSGMLFDGENLYVADSGNHAIRLINFKDGIVSTIIGSGSQGEAIETGENFSASEIELSSPTDLEFFPDKNTIAISNSGTNQILLYKISEKKISVLAGNGAQGNADGKGALATLAQTSDMAVFQNKLYFLDALTSSLRVSDEQGDVKTLIGNGEKFGHANGDKSKALMQNPLGLTADATGVYISDSFNHKIRKYDFASKQLRDLVGADASDEVGAKTRFDSPEGILTIGNVFYVADSNNNRVLIVNRGNFNSQILNVMPPLKLPKEGFLEYLPNLQKSEEVALKEDSEVTLKIDVNDGWKINEEGPSFINLLEMHGAEKADLITSFDWHLVKSKEMKLPKLSSSKDYLIQGTIYYCEDKKNALCYVKSYEQKISAKGTETEMKIKLGY
jgi:thiol-disulfide isomerase/thioredoxin